MWNFGLNIVKLAFSLGNFLQLKKRKCTFSYMNWSRTLYENGSFWGIYWKSCVGLWTTTMRGNDLDVVCGISQFYLDFEWLAPGMHSFHITRHLLFSTSCIMEVYNTLKYFSAKCIKNKDKLCLQCSLRLALRV